MSRPSDVDLRVLHAVRVLGYASTDRVARRARTTTAEAVEHLLDAEATGRVVRSAWDGDEGWSLTERGRAHGERQLAAELDAEIGRAHV